MRIHKSVTLRQFFHWNKKSVSIHNIEQNILYIRKVETSIETLENKLKENLKKKTTIQSSGRVLTGHKTAHDFDEQKLSELQAFRSELHSLITSLSQLQKTCKAAFKHSLTILQ